MPFLNKFFIFLIGLAVFAVVGAWILGGKPAKHSTSITIDVSPFSVFQYLTEGEKIKEWGSNIVSVGSFDEQTEEGKNLQKRVVQAEEREVVWEDSVLRFKVGESFSVQSHSGGLKRTYVFQLEENDIGGTNVRYRQTRSAGGLDQFTFWFQEDDCSKEMVAEMSRLKELIENEVDPNEMIVMPSSTEEAPLVASMSNGNNGDAEATPLQPVESEDEADRALQAQSQPAKSSQSLYERKFESLFGTGRPKRK